MTDPQPQRPGADPAPGRAAIFDAPGIEALHVARAFGQQQAVRNASISVAPGEITALVGPNGSGKTTLMLMLATLLRPDAGEIRIGGHDTGRDTLAARSLLGWMPDTLGAWDALTVRETLRTVCGMYGIRGSRADARVDALLASTALTPLASQRTHTLSRGQKQRLSLARALVHEPRALLLDEPASGLDPEARRAQREALSQLAAEGVAVLVTSHVLDELEQLATRVVFMRDGGTAAASATADAMRAGSLWRIRASDDAALAATLAELGHETTGRHTLAGATQTVPLESEAAASALLAALVTRDIRIIEFAQADSSLERAFVQLSQDRPEGNA